MARVLGRIRLSRSSDTSTSEDRQREQIERWAEQERHEIIGWAVDMDVSGSVRPFEAPSLSKWLEPGAVDEWDILCSASMDRISRNLFDFNEMCQWSQKNNKGLTTVKEKLDLSGIAGKMMALVLGIIAEGELEAIKARNIASQAELRKRGRWHGGAMPYGYHAVRVEVEGGYGSYLQPHPEESEIVVEMFRRAANRESLRLIAEDLNARGVPSRKQEKDGEPRWKKETIGTILASRNVLGQSVHNGEVVLGLDGFPLQRAEPIVSFDLWQEVQRVRAEKAVTKVRENGTGLLLNIAFCGKCKEPMYHSVYRPKGYEYHYWKCSGRAHKRNNCDQKGIRAEPLEGFTEDQVLEEIGHLHRTHKVFRPAEGYAEEIARTEEAIARLRMESDAGMYDGDTDSYMARLQPLVERRKTLAALPNRPAGWEVVSSGETYAEAWARMDTGERRKLLLDAGIKVYGYLDRKVPNFNLYVPVEMMQETFPEWSPEREPVDPVLIDVEV